MLQPDALEQERKEPMKPRVTLLLALLQLPSVLL